MSSFRLAIAVLLLGGTALLAARAQRPPSHQDSSIDVPYTIDEWKGEDTPADAEADAATAADQIVNRWYASTGSDAGLYIAYYAQQRPGVSIHSPLHCLPGTGWEVVSNTVTAVSLDGSAGTVRRLVAQKQSDRMLILYWYAINGRMIASELGSRLQLLHNRIRFGRNDAALVRVAVPVAGSDLEAERRAMAFARALAPHLRIPHALTAKQL
jgi:EpsI family protein